MNDHIDQLDRVVVEECKKLNLRYMPVYTKLVFNCAERMQTEREPVHAAGDAAAGKSPHQKYWPTDADTITATCPWCGQQTKSFIKNVRDLGEVGRLDECCACGRDIIIEACAYGIIAFRGKVLP